MFFIFLCFFNLRGIMVVDQRNRQLFMILLLVSFFLFVERGFFRRGLGDLEIGVRLGLKEEEGSLFQFQFIGSFGVSVVRFELYVFRKFFFYFVVRVFGIVVYFFIRRMSTKICFYFIFGKFFSIRIGCFRKWRKDSRESLTFVFVVLSSWC